MSFENWIDVADELPEYEENVMLRCEATFVAKFVPGKNKWDWEPLSDNYDEVVVLEWRRLENEE